MIHFLVVNDDISFTNTNDEIQAKAIKKAKEQITNAQLITNEQS